MKIAGSYQPQPKPSEQGTDVACIHPKGTAARLRYELEKTAREYTPAYLKVHVAVCEDGWGSVSVFAWVKKPWWRFW